MEQQNFALVPVSWSSSEEVDHPVELTPFGQFLAILNKRHSRPETSRMAGAILWIEEPVETIVASGLWMVAEKIAKTVGLDLTTQTRVQRIMKRLDRIVSAGLVLRYNSIADAATAFETQVLQVVDRAIKLGFRPGMPVSTKAWEELRENRSTVMVAEIRAAGKGPWQAPTFHFGQTLSALFFAALVKTARSFREQAKGWLNDLRRGNSVRGAEKLAAEYVDFSTSHGDDWLSIIGNSLDESQDFEKEIPEQVLRGLEKRVEEILFVQKALRCLRVDPKPWAGLNKRTVEYQWLNTQILLGILAEDEMAEELQGIGQFVRAVEMIQIVSEDEAIKLALERLNRRIEKTFSDKQSVWLREIVIARVQEIRDWKTGVFDDQASSVVIVRVIDDEWLVDPETAFDIVSGYRRELIEDVSKHGGNLDNWLKIRVFPAVIWRELEFEDFETVLEAGILSSRLMVEGALALNDELQHQAAVRLVEAGLEFDGQTIDLMLEKSLVELTLQFVGQYLGSFLPATLGRYLSDIIRVTAKSSTGSDFKLAWQVFSRIPSDMTQSVVDDVKIRQELYAVVSEAMDMAGMDIDWELFDLVRETLGADRYNLMMLGAEARQRSEDYKNPEVTGLSPWERMFESESGSFVKPRMFGHNLPDLTVITEEVAFRWVKAGEKNLDKSWARVAKLREKFFRRKG